MDGDRAADLAVVVVPEWDDLHAARFMGAFQVARRRTSQRVDDEED